MKKNAGKTPPSPGRSGGRAVLFQQRSSPLGIEGPPATGESGPAKTSSAIRTFRYAFVPFYLDDVQERRALFCVKQAVCGPSSGTYMSLASTAGPRTWVHGGAEIMRNPSKLDRRIYLSIENETLSIAPTSTPATLFSSGKAVRLMKSDQEEALH